LRLLRLLAAKDPCPFFICWRVAVKTLLLVLVLVLESLLFHTKADGKTPISSIQYPASSIQPCWREGRKPPLYQAPAPKYNLEISVYNTEFSRY
jgi:hypothetical protein